MAFQRSSARRTAVAAVAGLLASILPGVVMAPLASAVTGSDLIVTAAGAGVGGFSGDGASARRAGLDRPSALAADTAGNVYFADVVSGQPGRIRKIDTSGVINTVAGTSTRSFDGDGGPATQAGLAVVNDVEPRPDGSLYIADYTRVRRIDPAGVITTVAGGAAFSETDHVVNRDGGPAKAEYFRWIAAVAFDGAGNLYISEPSRNRVRKVVPGSDGVVDGDDDEIITTFAGAGVAGGVVLGSDDEGIQATSANIAASYLDIDAADSLYLGGVQKDRLGQTNLSRIRRIDTDGIITTVAGTGAAGYSGDGARATAADIDSGPLTVDASGTLYFAGGNRVRKVVPGPDGVVDGDAEETITTVAGTGAATYSGDGGPAGQAGLNVASGVAVDPMGALYISTSGDHRIRRVGPNGPLSLSMADSPDPVAIGAEVTYALSVTNSSPATATAVVLRDTLPVGTAYVSADPEQGSCGESGGEVSCTLGELGGGATTTVAMKVKAIEPTSAAFTNRAVVSSAEADPYPQDNIAVEKTAWTGANLRVAIADSPEPVALGGELTYTATVTNAGPGAASDISLTDTLPTGTTLRSIEAGPWACSEVAGTVSCNLSGLAPASSAVVRIIVVAPSDPTTLASTASVAAAEPDPALADNSDTEQTAVVAPVSLSITTTDSPEPATAGQALDYALTVTNDGPVTATAVVVTNTLPAGVTHRSSFAKEGTGHNGGLGITVACSHRLGTVTCRLGSLDPGASARVDVGITPTKSELLSNTATVASYEPDIDPADNTDVEETVVSTTGVPTGLGLATVDRPDPVATGQLLTYEFTATNGGPVPAAGTDDDPAAAGGVLLTDTLPAGVVFDSATSEQGSCSASAGTVTCNLGTIDPGAYVRAAITVVPTVPGTLTNNAKVTSVEAVEATSVVTTTAAIAPCGQVVTKDTVLKADIGPCESVGIMVGADNVTLDLGGHRIFGTPGPSDRTKNGGILGNQPGIYLNGRTNVTVRNGTVTDFDAGVFLQGGGSNTITGLTIRDNIGPSGSNAAVLGDGIALFDSANNRIVSNIVRHNGVYDGIGVLGGGSDGNLLEDNIVEDTYSVPELPGDNGQFNHGQGIMINASSIGDPRGQTIQNSRVVDNIVRNNGAAGISNINNYNGVIFSNTIEGNGGINGPANGIGIQTGPGASSWFTNLVIQSNEIHGNDANGVFVKGGSGAGTAKGNKVLNNDASDNGPPNSASVDDLRDGWGHCDFNTWSGNTAGTGGYQPHCTAAPDTTGPEVTIGAGPDGPTEDDTPTFEFSSPEPASTFQCRVDAQALEACNSPFTTPSLADGLHSFEVRAFDPAGNSASALRSFVVGTVPAALGAVADFDGDGSTDISVFRPSSGTWFPQGGPVQSWGTGGDIAVPADFDGDQDSEVAVFRPSSGVWFVQGGPTTPWGTDGDIPVPADYDGDGKADVAVFRPSSGVWYIQQSGGGPDQTIAWGTDGDVPVPGDHDGDGTTEVAVFRPSSGTWFVHGGPTTAWGTTGDVPVPGDYDADGTTDIAVFRPSAGIWFVDGGATTAWGTGGDVPVPGDYDADGSTDMAVFRPSGGAWFVLGGPATNWGTAGDQPLPLPASIRQNLAN